MAIGAIATYSATEGGALEVMAIAALYAVVNGPDLSMELVANQAVSPGLMVSGFDQFRRTVAGGL